MKNIQWFPGHMTRAMRDMEAKRDLCDGVICVLDARAPIATVNKNLKKIFGEKPILYLLNKADLADGGADAKAWMRRLGNRMKLWHVTDRGCRHSGSAMTPILKQDSVELGTGNMDLDGLWAIAQENGVEHVVLESHKNWVGKDPLQSLALSAKWFAGRK